MPRIQVVEPDEASKKKILASPTFYSCIDARKVLVHASHRELRFRSAPNMKYLHWQYSKRQSSPNYSHYHDHRDQDQHSLEVGTERALNVFGSCGI